MVFGATVEIMERIVSMVFKINDKVKSIAPSDNKRWRGIVVEVGMGQVKIRRISDKKGKDIFWILTNNLVIA